MLKIKHYDEPLQPALKVKMNNTMTSITNLQEKSEHKYCHEKYSSSVIASMVSPQTIFLRVKPHLELEPL